MLLMSNLYLLHAYSPSNSGDGTLVQESVDLARSTGYLGKITIVALDVDGFERMLAGQPHLHVISLPGFFKHMIVAMFSRDEYVFLGVGGGYLRSSNLQEGLKTFVAHGSQLFLSSLPRKVERIYLPQSIGPLKGLFGMLLSRLLVGVDTILARDDKTLIELKERNRKLNVVRANDLVARRILADFESNPRFNPEKVALVLRDLPSHKVAADYGEKLRRLYDLLGVPTLLIQSEGRGNDDVAFYKNLFPGVPTFPARSFLSQTPCIVVSVRLHGSLEAIHQGSPSVHLSYERKGFAAFEDLGLLKYCDDSSSFVPEDIAKRVDEIKSSPETYWALIGNAALSHIDNTKDCVAYALRRKA